MSSELATTGFSYDGMDHPEDAGKVRQALLTMRINDQSFSRGFIENGKLLIACKKALGHGHFLRWLEIEAKYLERVAQRMMSVAAQFTADQLQGSSLEPSALTMLAAKSTPEAARKAILDKAANGTVVTVYEVREVIAEHRGTKGRKPRTVSLGLPSKVVLPPQKPCTRPEADYRLDKVSGDVLNAVDKLLSEVCAKAESGDLLDIIGGYREDYQKQMLAKLPKLALGLNVVVALLEQAKAEPAPNARGELN